MFLREPQGLELAGGAGGRSFGRAPAPVTEPSRADGLREAAAAIDWTPDLGARIGSLDWWRGLATCVGLCAVGWALAPGLRPIEGVSPRALDGEAWEEARATAIAPLAMGADTGRRMAANDLVRPLAETPERPRIELSATLGDGDSFANALERAGVGGADAAAAERLVSGEVALGDIRPGTRLSLTLGRRPNRSVARPLEKLAFRARFDLNLSLVRAGESLAAMRQPIAVDHTPLRLQGLVGSSLYRSLRAAGAPAEAAADFIKALASRLSVGRDIAAADAFDFEIEQDRAATGETRWGRLIYAGLNQGDRRTQLVRWADHGREDWYDAHGQAEHRGAIGMPVAGRITSGFGMRYHPILGFNRFHKGIDIGAPWGSPVYAVVDGVVAMAGWAGGYGNFVKLQHGGGMMTGYGHLSRFAVRAGQHVARGQVIAYTGSTGMSTGPHLHWEVWRNGVAINPQTISFGSIATISVQAMQTFKARVATLLAVKPGGR